MSAPGLCNEQTVALDALRPFVVMFTPCDPGATLVWGNDVGQTLECLHTAARCEPIPIDPISIFDNHSLFICQPHNHSLHS